LPPLDNLFAKGVIAANTDFGLFLFVDMKTAFLIDGGFFIKRYSYIKGFNKSDSPDLVAKNLVSYCFRHIQRINDYRFRYGLPPTELYRIFYYDAEPFQGDSHHPITGKAFSFKRTDIFKFRSTLFTELKKQRKIALRLGFLKNSSRQWNIKSRHTKDLISGKKQIQDLNEFDVEYPLSQKAVDMKIGLDIATLAFKERVDQMILIAGDSDFVPAAKFARKEGIDFILDPMLNAIDPSLHEHIDGLMTIKSMQRNNGKKTDSSDN
jgi:uncharacterized LabA/DUF88 family protein